MSDSTEHADRGSADAGELSDGQPIAPGSRAQEGWRTHDVLVDTLRYAREREYTGWDYADGMSSRVLQGLPVSNQWLNLGVQETIKRAPVNLRRLFRVEQRRNFKGTALFVLANLNAAELTEESFYLEEAANLVESLIAGRSPGYSGFCGGHNHELQTLDGIRKPETPGIVGTSYAVLALLRASEQLEEPGYAETASTAQRFLFEDLGYETDGLRAQIKYTPTEGSSYRTLNANALGARMLLELFHTGGDQELLDGARKIFSYVSAHQTPIGGWHYRDPPEASHLSMDSHHNGFILEALLRYSELTGESRFDDTIDRGLSFYRTLFDADGAPDFDEHSAFPRDIHAAAQGILTFTRAGELETARTILEWVVGNLYAGEGKFYYRKQRYYTRRITLMRWCEAWMAYAVSELLLAHREP